MSLVPFLAVATLMLIIGLRAGKDQDDESFNIYDRRLPRLGFMISLAASNIGAGFFITGTAYAYRYGLGLLWLVFGAVLGLIIFGFYSKWLREKTDKLRLYTLPDLYRSRFGNGSAMILSVTTVFLMIGDISIQLIGGGKLLQSLNVLPYSTSVIITVTVVASYLMLSGFRAVIWTDYVLMFAILFLTCTLTFVTGRSFHPQPDQLNLFSIPPSNIIGFTVFGIFGPFALSTEYQRIFAANSSRTARQATWWSGLLIAFPAVCLLLIGMKASILFPGIDADLAFINMIQLGGKLTAVIGALVLWSALMATTDTLAFNGSQILSRDMLRKPLKRAYVNLGILIVLGLGVLIAFLMPSVTSMALVFLAGQIVITPSAFFLWIIKDLKGYSVITSLLSGLTTICVWGVLKGIGPDLIGAAFVVSILGLLSVHFAGRLMSKEKRVRIHAG